MAHAPKATGGKGGGAGFLLGLMALGSAFPALNGMGLASVEINRDWRLAHYRAGDREPALTLVLKRPNVKVKRESMLLPHLTIRMQQTEVPIPVFKSGEHRSSNNDTG